MFSIRRRAEARSPQDLRFSRLYERSAPDFGARRYPISLMGGFEREIMTGPGGPPLRGEPCPRLRLFTGELHAA